MCEPHYTVGKAALLPAAMLAPTPLKAFLPALLPAAILALTPFKVQQVFIAAVTLLFLCVTVLCNRQTVDSSPDPAQGQ